MVAVKLKSSAGSTPVGSTLNSKYNSMEIYAIKKPDGAVSVVAEHESGDSVVVDLDYLLKNKLFTAGMPVDV